MAESETGADEVIAVEFLIYKLPVTFDLTFRAVGSQRGGNDHRMAIERLLGRAASLERPPSKHHILLHIAAA